MKPGDLYRAEAPFRNGPGKKTRIVLVIKELNEREVLVVESRGKHHDHLNLIGVVDFSRRGYVGIHTSGVSHFYAENIRALSKSVFAPDPLGGLTPGDFKIFFERIAPFIPES